jgi:tRNA pseudouridine32 synthase/23S rRNA pseudouridine746 synthase/23S rRNA pseudouridine1911/1915/1917 synthase
LRNCKWDIGVNECTEAAYNMQDNLVQYNPSSQACIILRMAASLALDVIYCDDAVLVVNKAPGQLSQADATGDPDVLTLSRDWLADREGAARDAFLGLVHRLDRPASGLMVLARTSAAARNLSQQFRERTVAKRYLALVEGTATGIGTCVDYVQKDGRHVRIASPDAPNSQRAVLEWQSLAQEDGMSVVQVRLRTGRRHQIRVQLAHRGHPIVGDIRYGARRELDGQNLALHAYHLALEHPSTEIGMRWTVPPPSRWNDVLSGAHRTAINRLMAAA